MSRVKGKIIYSSKRVYDGKELPSRFSFDEVGQWPIKFGKSFRIWKIFYLYYEKGFFWFRFFGGYGIWGRSKKRKEFELFSERYGYTKYLKIFGWKFKTLKPNSN